VYYELSDQFEVPATPTGVWEFFTTAANLSQITPPWLAFSANPSNPTTIQQDTTLDYTIKWLGLPIQWRTKIIDYFPPRRFIDLQTKGPYILWHHQHTFTPTADNTVHCTDRIIYKLPLGPLGDLTHTLIVKSQLLQIFQHRRTTIAKNLGWTRALQPHPQIRRL
jgi:ligand-binding SRPBCC domain-containing protein